MNYYKRLTQLISEDDSRERSAYNAARYASLHASHVKRGTKGVTAWTGEGSPPPQWHRNELAKAGVLPSLGRSQRLGLGARTGRSSRS